MPKSSAVNSLSINAYSMWYLPATWTAQKASPFRGLNWLNTHINEEATKMNLLITFQLTPLIIITHGHNWAGCSTKMVEEGETMIFVTRQISSKQSHDTWYRSESSAWKCRYLWWPFSKTVGLKFGICLLSWCQWQTVFQKKWENTGHFFPMLSKLTFLKWRIHLCHQTRFVLSGLKFGSVFHRNGNKKDCVNKLKENT